MNERFYQFAHEYMQQQIDMNGKVGLLYFDTGTLAEAFEWLAGKIDKEAK